jgi:hypothetical protein
VDSSPAPDAPEPPPSDPNSAGPHGPAGSALSPAGQPAALSPLRVLAAVCILLPIIAVFWVPWFNRLTPEVLGFPFFYWYQLVWVVLTAALLTVATSAVRRDEAARRGRNGAGR